jgi:hypothetical protein
MDKPKASNKSVYNKNYYMKHKNTILEYMKTKVQCECGAFVSRANKSSHVKTKKHCKLLIDKKNQTPVV